MNRPPGGELRELLVRSIEMMDAEMIERTIANVFAYRIDFALPADKVDAIKTAIAAALVQQLTPDAVISLAAAARELGIHHRTLRKYIAAGRGPVAIKLTDRHIGIRRSELTKWLNRQSDPPADERKATQARS